MRMVLTSYWKALEEKAIPEPENIATCAKNGPEIICNKCDTIVFKKNVANPTETTSEILPDIGSKSVSPGKKVEYYWSVTHMLDFENIGFTKPTAYKKDGEIMTNIRYLTCAGCDIGPIGYEAFGGVKFYIAADRVRYKVL